MSSTVRTLLFLFVMTNLIACTNNATQGESNEKNLADAFLKLISAGKTEEAWNSTSAEFKSFMGQAQFQSTVAANPFLKKEVPFEKAEKNEVIKGLTYCTYKETNGKKTLVIIVGPDPDALRVQGMKIE